MQFPFFRSPWQRAHRGPVLLACAFVLLAASNARASSELDAGTSTNANAGTSAEPARFQLQSIAVENSTVLTATDVEKIASRWRGRFVGGFELFAIQREISELYEQRGYRGSGVLLGDQAVLQGAVRFHAREVRLSAVVVSPPPRWLRAFVVTNWFAAETNALLNVNRLQDRLSMLRDSPHLTRIDADLSVAQENTSQAVLKLTIEEPFPIAAWLSAANNRNPGIGSVRHEIGVSHRSLLGFGDTLEWRGGRTEGLADTAWSYSLPVPKTRFTMFASRNKGDSRAIEPRVFKDLDIAAVSDSRSAGISYALLRSPAHSLSAGALHDRRISETTLLGFPFSFTPGIADGRSRVDVNRGSIEYAYRANDRYASLRVLVSRGEVSPRVDADIPGAVDARFSHAQLGIAAAQTLFGKDWELRARLDAQFSRDTLPPVERLSFGGANGVRGYRENLFLRDSGAMARIELVPPPAERWGGALRVSPLVFVDVGWGRDSVRRADGFPSTLSSAGVGMDARIMKYLRLNVALAVPANRKFRGGGNAQDRGIHVQAAIQLP